MAEEIHILAGFVNVLRELNYVREMSPELEINRAASAHALLQDVARRIDAQPDVNTAENALLPRVAMSDIADMEILADAMQETTTEIKRDLVNLAGRYAMGNDELSLHDLHRLADKYVTACRLTTALLVHGRDKERQAAKDKQAANNAAAAYKTMDEQAGFGPLPERAVMQTWRACGTCGQPAIREHLASGKWFCGEHED